MLPRRDFVKQTGMLLAALSIHLPVFSNSKNSIMRDPKQYDVIIVGGSYAGLAAAMALGRALRQVLVIDGGNPCNKQTPYSHNFLTNDGKPPAEITALAREEVQRYRNVALLNGMVTKGKKTDEGFDIELESGDKYTAKKLVFATGIKDIFPDIPGFAESWGISVLHCPYCHGYEVRGQKIGILANGELALELASLISNWTDNLTVYTNGFSTLAPEQVAKLRKHNIEIIEDKIARLDQDKGYVTQIVFENGRYAPVAAIYARLPFIQHSPLPAELGCQLTPEGYLKIDLAQKTTLPGIFACGDNTTRMRTVANAVSMGTTTGLMVNKELIEQEF